MIYVLYKTSDDEHAHIPPAGVAAHIVIRAGEVEVPSPMNLIAVKGSSSEKQATAMVGVAAELAWANDLPESQICIDILRREVDADADAFEAVVFDAWSDAEEPPQVRIFMSLSENRLVGR